MATASEKLAAARAAYAQLRVEAASRGLGFDWVLASLAIFYHESGGFDPKAHNAADPGPYGSNGIAQLNSKAHPSVTLAQAQDPAYSVHYWMGSQNPAGWWAHCGGSASFAANPIAFMQCYAKNTQGSDPWTVGHAGAALAGVTGMLPSVVGLGATGDECEGLTPEQCAILRKAKGSISNFNPGGGIVPGIPDIPNPVEPIKGAIGGIGDFLSLLTQASTWERITIFSVGGALLLLGVTFVLSTQREKIVSAAGAV